jgi:nucleoside-diphosphate-sugar epimerase
VSARLETSLPVNVGSGEESAIADLARRIATLAGFTGEIRFDPSQPAGPPRRRLDVSRARDLMGFEATTSFDDGLARTVDWYLATHGG